MATLTYIPFAELEFAEPDTEDMIMESLEDSEFTFGDGIGMHLISVEDLLHIFEEYCEDSPETIADAQKAFKKVKADYIQVD